MFDQLISDLNNTDYMALSVAFIAVCCIVVWSVGAKRLALAYAGITLAMLTFGDGILEIPAAQILSESRIGFFALTMCTIGVKCSATMAGFYPCSKGEKRFRDFIFICYSIMISIIGQYAIFADGDLKKANVSDQIADLVRERDSLQLALDGDKSKGIAPCVQQKASVCISSDVRKELAVKNNKIAALRKIESVQLNTALSGLTELFGISPVLIVFIIAFLRSFIVMYATLFVSKITAGIFYSIKTGLTFRECLLLQDQDFKDGSSDGLLTVFKTVLRPEPRQTNKTKTMASPVQTAVRNKRSSLEDGECLDALRQYAKESKLKKHTRTTANRAFDMYLGRTIDNTRASALAAQYNTHG